MPDNRSKIFLWSKYFVMILLCSMLAESVQQLFNSSTSLYVVSLGGTASYASFLTTFFTGAAIAMRIFSGQLLDKRGRRFTIIVGAAIYGAASVSFRLGWLPYLAVAHFFHGIGFSMVGTGLSVAVTDVVPKARMGEGISIYSLGGSLAQALGPVIALALCDNGNGSFSSLYYTAGGFCLTIFLVFFIVRYEKDSAFMERKRAVDAETEAVETVVQAEDNQTYKGAWKIFEKSALKPTFIYTFIQLSTASIVAFLTLYAKDIGIEQISLYFTIVAISMTTVRMLLGKITDKYGPLVSMVPACLVGMVGFLMLLLARNASFLFYVAPVFIGACSGIAQPAMNATVIKRASDSRRGVASSTFMISFDAGIGIGGLLWGIIYKPLGYNGVFIGSIISIAVALLLSFIWLRNEAPAKKEA